MRSRSTSASRAGPFRPPSAARPRTSASWRRRMDDEEHLGQRIVSAIDALPVPPRPARTPSAKERTRWERAFGPFVVAVTAAVALLLVVPLVASQRAATQPSRATFNDDFAAGIDRARWTTMGAGSGNSVTAVD